MNKLNYLLIFILFVSCRPKYIPTEQWHYIQIDDQKVKWGDFAEPDWLRYFGLDATDFNTDGFLDVVSGRNVYLNPGCNMSGTWEKIDLGINVDAMITVDLNNNGLANIIAEAFPDVYWFEATNETATKWTAKLEEQILPTSPHNGQDYRAKDIIPGGKTEVLLSGQEEIYLLELPEDDGDEWQVSLIGENATDEGLSAGNVGNDGDLDIVSIGWDQYNFVHLWRNDGIQEN